MEKPPGVDDERRAHSDRRRRMWWSILYGNVKPRRRSPARRQHDPRFHFFDWHSPHLLALAMGILILSVADAFLTVTLLANGAIEVNPIMAAVVYKNVALFTALKTGLTGVSVMLMVFLARYRFLRRVRVDVVLYAVLVGYAGLISYELWMLDEVVDFRFL